MNTNIKIKETNTTPVVIHAAGHSKREPGGVWETLSNTFMANQQLISVDEDIDVTIVTWKGGKFRDEETILETMMRYYDFPIVILDWPENTNFWEGSKSKVTETLKAINDGLINTKYVMWFDASDVMLTRHPKDILDGYLKHFSNFELVFNAERNNYPKSERMVPVDSKLRARFDEVINFDESKTHGTSYKYLNSGVMVGKTEYLKKFLEHASTIGIDEPINDTVMCRIAQYDMKDKVTADNECKLFVCLYNGPISEQEVHLKDVEITVSDEEE